MRGHSTSLRGPHCGGGIGVKEEEEGRKDREHSRELCSGKRQHSPGGLDGELSGVLVHKGSCTRGL